MISLDVEFLADDKIKAIVEQFRNRLPIKIIPVPIDAVIEQAKRKGMARNVYLEYAIEHLANSLSPSFEVSIDVLKNRIRADRLEEFLP